MKRIIIASFLLFTGISYSQKNVFITISPKVEGNDMGIHTIMTDINGKSFSVNYFDYYLSDVVIVHDGGQIMELPQEVYIIEPGNYVKYLGLLDLTVIEEIRFGVGVPENLNTISGADAIDIVSYPLDHPLSFQDPSMHWGWTSGYAHMIVGGMADSNNDGTPDEIFEVHSLGDLNYANVVLPVIATETYTDQLDINMNCNLDIWLTGVNLGTIGVLHGTENENVLVMGNPEILPVFDQPLTASVEQVKKNPGKIWFYNHAESMEISWEGLKYAEYFQLIDVQGKIVSEKHISSISGSVLVNGIDQGAYRLVFLNKEGQILKTINTVR